MLDFDLKPSIEKHIVCGGVTIKGKEDNKDQITFAGLEPGYYDFNIEIDMNAFVNTAGWEEKLVFLFGGTDVVNACKKDGRKSTAAAYMKSHGLIYAYEKFGDASTSKGKSIAQTYYISGTVRVEEHKPLILNIRRMYRNRKAALKVEQIQCYFANHADLEL